MWITCFKNARSPPAKSSYACFSSCKWCYLWLFSLKHVFAAHRSSQACIQSDAWGGGASAVRLVGHDMWFHKRRGFHRSHPFREFSQVNTPSRWVKACRDFDVGCGLFMLSKARYCVLRRVPWNYGYRGVRLHINVFLSRGKESVCHKSREKPTPSLWMKSQSRYGVYFYFLTGTFICQMDIKCDVRQEIEVLWDGWQLFWRKAEVSLNLITYSVVFFFSLYSTFFTLQQQNKLF